MLAPDLANDADQSFLFCARALEDQLEIGGELAGSNDGGAVAADHDGLALLDEMFSSEIGAENLHGNGDGDPVAPAQSFERHRGEYLRQAEGQEWRWGRGADTLQRHHPTSKLGRWRDGSLGRAV